MFKVGDICKLKVNHDYDLYRFIRIDGNRAYLQDRLGFTEFGINKDVVMHATPEEIAAGHRIESSNSQAISDCSVSNLCQNDTQNSLPIKQENQDMGDDSHI